MDMAMALAASSSSLYSTALLLPSHSRLPGAPLCRNFPLARIWKQQNFFVSLQSRGGASWPSLVREPQCGKSRRYPVRNIHVHAQTEQTTEQGSVDDEVCELVNGFDVELGEGDEGFSAYFIQALKNNNGAGILLLSDVYGYESSGIRDFVYRLACFGYNVLVPDLFRGDPWSDERSGDDFEDWRSTHSPERIAKDIDVSTEWLRNVLLEQEFEESAFGVVGFCIGGGQALQTVARHSDTTYATAVSFYGTRIDPALANSIKVPLLLVSGDCDKKSPLDVLREVEKKVDGSKVLIYPGRGHAFAHMPDTLEDDEAADESFTAMRHWLHDHLLTTRLST